MDSSLLTLSKSIKKFFKFPWFNFQCKNISVKESGDQALRIFALGQTLIFFLKKRKEKKKTTYLHFSVTIASRIELLTKLINFYCTEKTGRWTSENCTSEYRSIKILAE